MIIDVFDVLMSECFYKKVWSEECVIVLIEFEVGKYFDFIFVFLFLECLEEIREI